MRAVEGQCLREEYVRAPASKELSVHLEGKTEPQQFSVLSGEGGNYRNKVTWGRPSAGERVEVKVSVDQHGQEEQPGPWLGERAMVGRSGPV